MVTRSTLITIMAAFILKVSQSIAWINVGALHHLDIYRVPEREKRSGSNRRRKSTAADSPNPCGFTRALFPRCSGSVPTQIKSSRGRGRGVRLHTATFHDGMTEQCVALRAIVTAHSEAIHALHISRSIVYSRTIS